MAIKKVVANQEKPEDVVELRDIDMLNIYAFNTNNVGILKLHNFKGNYIFASMSDSKKGWNGYYDSAEKAIKAVENYNIYQFDTEEEFYRWALEQVTDKKFEKIDYCRVYTPTTEVFA